jgi:hypothetical protein
MGLRAMNCRWCLWSISFCERFRNRPYCLRCDYSSCEVCFPSFKCPFRTILLLSRMTQFTVVLNTGFLVSCHNFLSFLLCFNRRSKPGISYFQSKIVVFIFDNLYAETMEAEKSRVCFISIIRRVNFDIWSYDFRGEALKQLSVCQFFNFI